MKLTHRGLWSLINVSTDKSVGNIGKNLAQNLHMSKIIGCSKISQKMSNLINKPNQKYLCQPPPKYAKLLKFRIKIC